MPLPEERNTTYVAGVSQVKAADLNAMQDEIVSAHYHGARVREITPIGAESNNAAWQNSGYLESSAANRSYVRLDAVQGERITDLKIRASGSGNIDARLMRTSGGTVTEIDSFNTGTLTGSFVNYGKSPWAAEPVDGADDSYYVILDMSASGGRVSKVMVTYDRPAP